MSTVRWFSFILKNQNLNIELQIFKPQMNWSSKALNKQQISITKIGKVKFYATNFFKI